MSVDVDNVLVVGQALVTILGVIVKVLPIVLGWF